MTALLLIVEISMEYMSGGTIARAIESYGFEESNIAFISRELLKALEYLHYKGLVHRFSYLYY